MTREAFALGLAGLIAVAAIVAVPYSVWLLRDAHRMAAAVDLLDVPKGRRTIARAHVRASRFRVALASLVTIKAFILALIVLDDRRVTGEEFAFLVLFAGAKVLRAVDAAQLARDRRAILRDAQRHHR